MKTTKKALLSVLCALLLVVASVMGTLAYLQDSESVLNTFTVGNVDIKLDETDLSENAKEGDRTEVGNSYKLYPGQTYTKDPTVSILEGSEASYVRMIVTVEDYTELKAAFPASKYATWYADGELMLQYLCNGWNPATWQTTNEIKVDTAADTATYEFRYKETVSGPAKDDKEEVAATALDALFTEIKVPEIVTNEELAKLATVKIKVEAHAIQVEGFTTADQAWAKFTK